MTQRIYGDWKEWFAWRPIRLRNSNRDSVWLRKIYRRTVTFRIDMDWYTRYEYGTILTFWKRHK